MTITVADITVECQNCRMVTPGAAEADWLDIEVPIADEDKGYAFNLALRCTVRGQRHEISLLAITDAQGRPADLPETMHQRLELLLRKIEDSRVCGNGKLCPQSVSAAVRRLSLG